MVVLHDATVDHTTNGTGKVSQLTLAALQELDAGSHFGPQFQGESIPTLEEAFETLGRQLLINVELKDLTTRSDALAEKVALIVKRHHLEKHVLFSSFNPLALRAARRYAPEVPAGLLFPKGGLACWLGSLAASRFACDTLHPHFSDISPQFVERTHQDRQRVLAYTVNAAADLRRLIAMEVDGIITDDPLLAQSVLEKVNARP